MSKSLKSNSLSSISYLLKKSNEIQLESVDKLKQSIIEYVQKNKLFLNDPNKIIWYIQHLTDIDKINKYKIKLEQDLLIENTKQEILEMILENDINVGKETLENIVTTRTKKELRYLAINLKYKYHLNDIESHKHVYDILNSPTIKI